MRRIFGSSSAASLVAGAFVLLSGTASTQLASASTATWAGPSVVKVAETGVFSGRKFAPNMAVTIAVRTPDGSEAHYGAVTSVDGSLDYSFKPVAPGRYSLRVLNSAGQQISAAVFNSIP